MGNMIPRKILWRLGLPGLGAPREAPPTAGDSNASHPTESGLDADATSKNTRLNSGGAKRSSSRRGTSSRSYPTRVIEPIHLFSETPQFSHSSAVFVSNRIKTTKYTIWSFLPKNLFEQFHRFANLYFLFIVLLNWAPEINAFGKEVAMLPVLFVLGVTAIKDAYEDRRRYLSDNEINNQTCRVFVGGARGRYVKQAWQSVKVGDIVHLSCNEIIPADIVLLNSSDDDGICYAETSSLDGESNLKQRKVTKDFFHRFNEFEPAEFQSTVECERPNNQIHKFTGCLITPTRGGEHRDALTKDNIVLRGCVVRNTDYVEGIVVYAGHETKVMLNDSGPRYKQSKLEKMMNRDVVFSVIILVVLCCIGAIGSGVWSYVFSNPSKGSVPFIPIAKDIQQNALYAGVIAFLSYVIILQVLIPISLYVSLEFVKMCQIYFITQDGDLYYEEKDQPMVCRALNISEDLGQVEMVFSDKTGTLTENQMIFRRCTIGGVDYPYCADDVKGASVTSPPRLSSLNFSPGGANQGTPPFLPTCPKSNFPQTAPVGGSPASSTRSFFSPLSFPPNSPLSPSAKPGERCIIPNPELHHAVSQISFGPTYDRQSQKIQDFFVLMAVCNTVVVSLQPHEDLMNASGLFPDDLSLNYSDAVSTTVSTDGVATYSKMRSGGESGAGNPPSRRLPDPPVHAVGANAHSVVAPKQGGGLGRILQSLAAGDPLGSQTRFSWRRTNTPSESSASTASSATTHRLRYEGESPDEVALVHAAAAHGCKLTARNSEYVTVALPGDELIDMEILHILGFDSNRKRMSVIIRDPSTREIVLYCKGADSSILPNLKVPHPTDVENYADYHSLLRRTKEHMDSYSTEGLRTLCLAKRVLTLEQYRKWLRSLKEAEAHVGSAHERMMQEVFREIESDLELLGATGVEDRLQEGVPETIAALRKAGIRLWVLTGDKMETARNIAHSCRLFEAGMEVIPLVAKSAEALREILTHELNRLVGCTSPDVSPLKSGVAGKRAPTAFTGLPFLAESSTNLHEPSLNSTSFFKQFKGQESEMDIGLIIDGQTLAHVLTHSSTTSKRRKSLSPSADNGEVPLDLLFLQLACLCRSVVCCRTTPSQKGAVVRLVKENLGVLTLAIGDGANDVAMIHLADVGVGISGQEGMQAIMASDFAIARFRFLKKLLLVHGHWCYSRLSYLILYFFYKNANFVIMLFWYQFFNGFTGQVHIDEMYLMFFNVLFTGVPPLISGILDQDLTPTTLYSHSYVYKLGQTDAFYRSRNFWLVICDAVWQSLVMYFIPHFAYVDSDIGIWELGSVCLTGCIIGQLVTAILYTQTWTVFNALAILMVFLMFWSFAFIYNSICVTCVASGPYWVIHEATTDFRLWLCVVLVAFVSVLPRVIIAAAKAAFKPSVVTQHRALEQIRANDIRRLRSDRRSSLKANPLRRKNDAGERKTSGAKGVVRTSSTTPTTTTPIQRHPQRCASSSDAPSTSTPQPRPHSDFIPGVNDDRYLAAWRKRGPVTLLNVAAAATTTAAELSAGESRSSDDDGGGSGGGGASRRVSSLRPSNPKLQQTIQEVLSESSNDSTDEFLGNDAQCQQQQKRLSQPLSTREQLQQPPPLTHSPGQVSIRTKRSDHLRLDESGESETDHHTLPELSV